jgi:glyoxylase-like metal-dependent hydrolase (beta-lactamase superfamily II)
MQPLQFGKINVSRVVESEGPTPPGFLLPDASQDGLRGHADWMAPHFFDPATGKLIMSVQTFILRTRHHTILVDTCVGNDKKRAVEAWHMREGSYLADLAAAGVTPEQVDFVLCTHLHVDHVGWNTRLRDGRWVPTFPNARYLFARKEWEHWKESREEDIEEILRDSVRPILEADQADLVEGDHEIEDGLWLEPTPGHTPGHVSLRISSGKREGVITGDLLHHPVQMAELDWCSHFCVDPAGAIATRKAFLGRYADRDVKVLGTHFPTPVAGRVVGAGDSWRFTV